jgi:hypothetical protein
MLQKAQGENDLVLPIRMIANRLELDRENQEILPQAFSKATVEKFLDEGIIDWHHQSVLGKTPEARAQAIIGKPTGFQWESGLPVVYGNLTKAHPIVSKSIQPHLEAGQDVFGASVGGNITKAQRVFDQSINKAKDQISAIDWNHIAVAALPYVVSGGSRVSMAKASNDLMIEFSDLSSFSHDYRLINNEDHLRKALTAGYGTDSAALGGFDALRTQSLEGATKGQSFDGLKDMVMMGIIDGSISPSRQGVIAYLTTKGINERTISRFMDTFRDHIRALINQI